VPHSTAVRAPQNWVVGALIAALPWCLFLAGISRAALALSFSQTPAGVRWGNDFVDLGVYRLGGTAVLEGLDLYQVAYEIGDLPFTYPPFAALLFVPFALVPFGIAQVAMVLVGLSCVVLSAWLVASNLHLALGRELPWSIPVTTMGLAGLGLMLEPTTTTLDLGQVNLILMALVLFDSLVAWRFAGALVGVSAGVKIVPGIFVLAMVTTRRWKQVRNACVAFLGTVVIGALVLPSESWAFWSRMFYSESRQASVVTILNQSLYSDAVRLLGKPGGIVAWVVVGGLVLVLGLLLAGRVWTADRLTSTTAVAVTGLLVSPVSWNHHWVWLMPAFATATAIGVRSWLSGRRWAGALAVGYVLLATSLTAVGPIKLVSASTEFDPTLSNWTVGNSLVLAGLGYLIVVWRLHAALDHDRSSVRAGRTA
jgi:alpha-1,2-mannosyltransferase